MASFNEADLREALKMPKIANRFTEKSDDWLNTSHKFFVERRKKLIASLNANHGEQLAAILEKYRDGVYNYSKTGDEFLRYLRGTVRVDPTLCELIAELLVVYNSELNIVSEKNNRIVFEYPNPDKLLKLRF